MLAVRLAIAIANIYVLIRVNYISMTVFGLCGYSMETNVAELKIL